MDFQPLSRSAPGKPIIAAKAKMATISLPPACASASSLMAGKCTLGIATEGKATFLQVKMDDAGEYTLAKRGKNLVASVAELLPERPTEDQSHGVEMLIHSTDNGLILQLPKDWRLAGR